jgi:hypothetical protein
LEKILKHLIPLLREGLHEQQIDGIFFSLVYLFSLPWEVTWVGESDFPQEKLARDPTLYTLTSLGTCKKKQKGVAYSNTTDPNYFENKMKVEI